VVVGSKNSLVGNNDWVFASDYLSTNPSEGVLIIDNYLIELNEIMAISYNPRGAIKCLMKVDSNSYFRTLWYDSRETRRAAF
jgi:hypothetical protein